MENHSRPRGATAMEWVEWALYAGIGVVAGFFAGLLGIGGGVITGPLLIVIFVSLLGFDPDASAYLAIGTAMATISVTSLVSAVAHTRRGNVDWRFARRLALGAIVGGLGGVHIALLIPASVLKFFLAMFLLFNALVILFSSRQGAAAAASPATTAKPAAATPIVAAGIGAVSAALGIGGGIIMVPYLTRVGMPIVRAIGTSTAFALPLSAAAAVGYALNDAKGIALPQDALGLVYLPAFFGIALFALLTAPIGASLTTVLPANLLRRIFALMMLLITGRLLSFLILPA